MTTPEQIRVLLQLQSAAKASSHMWPSFAACEGVLESAWGTSKLFLHANNVFGQKQSTATAQFPAYELPTREFIEGKFVTVMANWVSFPTVAESFTARMNLLRRDASKYPNYAAALDAETGVDFVTWVSKTWSTDPNRGKLVLEIYDAHRDIFG